MVTVSARFRSETFKVRMTDGEIAQPSIHSNSPKPSGRYIFRNGTSGTGQDYRIGSLAKRTYINENRHENGISNYIWQNDSAEILIFSRIVF